MPWVGTTVFADGDKDWLNDGKGQDWFFADAEDKVKDKGGSDGGSDKDTGKSKKGKKKK